MIDHAAPAPIVVGPNVLAVVDGDAGDGDGHPSSDPEPLASPVRVLVVDNHGAALTRWSNAALGPTTPSSWMGTISPTSTPLPGSVSSPPLP